ncbi:hypothetical protein H0A73_12015 [Alcaligenaceae bacterium]|nr:hypothetical protein [Alcaligenaceae bacterium]
MPTTHRPAAHRLAVALLLATCFLPAAASAKETAPDAALEALNAGFRSLYHQRTRQVLEALPLVLVVQNHAITAVRGTQRRLYSVPTQRHYLDARAIVHAALGFHGLMSSLAQAGPEAAGWTQADAFRQNLRRGRGMVDHTALSHAEKSLAREVLDLLDDATRQALSTRDVQAGWIAATLSRAEPLLAAFAESVGRAHAHSMLAVLAKVRSDATPEEWANVVAVVTGPMTPRRNNLDTAIVASVLGKEHLGTRIFYSENIFSVDGALDYLQIVAGDQELSRDVFGDPKRMWEDLFAPVSRTLVEGDFYTELGK